MDYFDRLMQRALAQPREVVEGLFDPFAQEAPWSPDGPRTALPTAPHHPSSPADGRAATVRTRSTPEDLTPANIATSPTSVPPLAAPVVTHRQPALPHQEITPAVAADRPLPMHPPEHTGTPTAPLSHADAFMRTLGVPVAAPAQTTPRSSAPPQGFPAPMMSTPRSAPAEQRESTSSNQGPTALRPVNPTTVPRPSADQTGNRARTQAAPATSSPAPPPMPQASASASAQSPAAPPRFIQRTVVVSATSPRLDDLAHSSGISRFGIGQG